jgi:hypothetical protein
MLKLSVPGNVVVRGLSEGQPAILRVTTNANHPSALREQSALLLDNLERAIPEGFGAVLARGGSDHAALPDANVLIVTPDLQYLADGDVIKISSDGRIRTIYRRAGRGVSLLVTERCNSFCVMCSQPPRDVNDDYLIDDYLRAIPLFDRSTREIGITGGEPTLLGDRLFTLLQTLKAYLPETAVHVLTNGRTSRDQTYQRLPQLASFIARNLQFVDHVALMGLELMGFARSNIDALWIDPVDYQRELAEATLTLARAGIRTSIYNHQLCLLDPSIRAFSVKSISDWKNEYMPECAGCSLMSECGGFFSSASLRRSPNIRAMRVA